MLQNLTVVTVAQLGKFNEGHWSDLSSIPV